MKQLLAQTPIMNKSLPTSIQNLSGVDYLNRLIPNLITLAIIIAAVTALFFLLLGAIRLIASSGDKAGVESAKGTITHAITGLILVLIVFAVLGVLNVIFGINLLKFDFQPLIIK